MRQALRKMQNFQTTNSNTPASSAWMLVRQLPKQPHLIFNLEWVFYFSNTNFFNKINDFSKNVVQFPARISVTWDRLSRYWTTTNKRNLKFEHLQTLNRFRQVYQLRIITFTHTILHCTIHQRTLKSTYYIELSLTLPNYRDEFNYFQLLIYIYIDSNNCVLNWKHWYIFQRR